MRDHPLPACPDDAVLARAVSHGADEALTAHLRGCARCETLLREHRELVDLVGRLPFVPPSQERRQLVRNALLGGGLALRRPGRAGWAALAGGGLLAAAAVVVLLLVLPLRKAPLPPPLASRAIIEAASGARFERVSGPPHEVVRLYEGTIRTTVPPATHGETVRIVTGAGEVEVRGTVFDTTARHDRLVAVKVQRGRVVVRAPRAAAPQKLELALEAGRSWELPPEVEPATVAPAPAPPPAPHPAKLRPRAAPAHKPDPAEQAFGEGMVLLRASDRPAAARAFDRAVRLAPLGTLAEDASYWRAVALTGNPGGEEALLAFLDRFPQSARAGEISVMLGWRLLDRDVPAAAARFDAGLADRSARVRKSARAGLDAVARKRALQDRSGAPSPR